MLSKAFWRRPVVIVLAAVLLAALVTLLVAFLVIPHSEQDCYRAAHFPGPHASADQIARAAQKMDDCVARLH